MTFKKTLVQSTLAFGVGAGAGIAWHALNRAMVYYEFFRHKDNYWNKPALMCVRHPGNGLLLWTNGDLQCYQCGSEKYDGTEVTRDSVRQIVDYVWMHKDHYHDTLEAMRRLF